MAEMLGIKITIKVAAIGLLSPTHLPSHIGSCISTAALTLNLQLSLHAF